uniref:Solute carrier family 41 member n=1 Tax=Melopsittacus undulatus TaxID=13146 RepID=A0A8V5HIK8_MELUD
MGCGLVSIRPQTSPQSSFLLFNSPRDINQRNWVRPVCCHLGSTRLNPFWRIPLLQPSGRRPTRRICGVSWSRCLTMVLTNVELELCFHGQKLRGFKCKVTRLANGFLPETSFSIASQVFLPFLLSGLGMVATGLLMDTVQHWPVFQTITEIFILVPALLGLKGNLEMTLASRLSTAVSVNRMQMVPYRLSFGLQLQATVVGLLAALAAVILEAISKGSVDLSHAAVLCASSVLTAFLAALCLGLLMIGVITGARKAGINPDNVATPLAASLGDLITLWVLSAFSSLFFEYMTWLPPLVCAVFIIMTPFWVCAAKRSPSVAKVLKSGWLPVIVAMIISSIGGLILDKTVTNPNFEGMAVFTPVMNGVGGSLVAIQASRISTFLHLWSKPGVLPYKMRQNWPNPCTIFFSSEVNSRSARVLFFLALPGHLVFLYTIRLLHGGHVSLSFPFVMFYLMAALLQVGILLYVTEVLVRLMWRKEVDPDNFSIPYLTALADFLGTALLAGCFHLVWLIHGFLGLPTPSPCLSSPLCLTAGLTLPKGASPTDLCPSPLPTCPATRQ